MAVQLRPSEAHLRLNAICPYFTMFPLSFPYRYLAAAAPGDWVLDPFCGRGTTGFAARLHGLPSAGVDASPVAAALAAAKLVHTTAEDVIAAAETLLAGPDPSDVPSGPFWELAFHHQTLIALCRIREGLLRACDTPPRILLRALLLGILHGPRNKGAPSYLSNQMPRTYATKPGPAVRFWRRRGMAPSAVSVLDAIARRARFCLAHLPPAAPGMVRLGDSRDAGTIPCVPGGYGWVVTSPPYQGMRTYQPDQWLRLWFLGGGSTVRYVRDGQVRHHANEYLDDLALVWRNVAARCRPGARLAVRFGCIPTLPLDPEAALRRSPQRSGAPWRVVQVEGAGIPPRHRRQADQFEETRPAREEVDVLALLEA